MTDPIKPGVKPGRPRVAEPKAGAGVSTWLAPAEYDQLIKMAKARDVTISALVRSWLQLKIKS
jgi:hypothetical protein